MPKPYKHLTEDERDQLSLFKAQGKPLREIAGLIGRNVSTVSRELKRNAPPIRQGYYLPHRAQERADARKAVGHERERLRKPHLKVCNSCHGRMDPLGMALENFNAAGMWRAQEYGEAIEPSGRLITGESVSGAKDLKRALVKRHYKDFYRTLTEKMLTYALGRGLGSSDVETVDQIAARIENAGGRSSALLAGIVESAPFQKMRVLPASDERLDEAAAGGPSRP